ncbi:carbon-nitrogen hydrolase family protein [Agrococcus sp. SGAir0287]|uniref:carbon-nitrogen hydrolase family protein n=1 Tax=Agrococcus sp. SGAir0287 TaxID=2070347 RepID=UPI0010CCC679|nr:carbon-nitrogen hydrolase family protein [Agrococcus sp. SGAir0287]QCR18892.1 hydrolase [Agrococcus sp. SGAir0287]
MATPSTLLAAAVQWAPGADPAENRAAVTRLVAAAAQRGARLVVLPEYSQAFAADMAALAPTVAEPLDGPFVATLQQAAAAAGAVVVAGLVERIDHGTRVANTVVAVDGERLLAAYRKVHLYDAFGARESDWLTPGDPAQRPVIDVDGHGIGIQTCYDVRFPEQSRLLVDAGADVLVVPAEWVRGPLKEHHWVTLVTARAIESTVHVVAADHAPPIGAGRSLVVDPMGVALAQLGEAEGIALAPIDPARTASVRERNPSLANRRHRVVGG